jgi:hypothetical protein
MGLEPDSEGVARREQSHADHRQLDWDSEGAADGETSSSVYVCVWLGKTLQREVHSSGRDRIPLLAWASL